MVRRVITARRALYVYSNGDWNYYYCSDSYAVRPALIVSSSS